MPKIAFEFPKKLEIVLLVLMIFSLFLFDINLNKLNDLGLNYKVTIFGDLQVKAFIMFWISIILYHILLVSIYTRAILRKGTHYILDYIVGTVMLFGTLILISGGLGHFYYETINLGFTTLKIITYYHIGIALQVLGSIWFAITE